MTPLFVFEDSQFDGLFPLTYPRCAAELRCGGLTLLERMQRALGRPINGLLVREGLGEVTRKRVSVPVNPGFSAKEGVILINARWLMLAAHTPWSDAGTDTAGLSADSIVWMHLSPELAAKVDLSKLYETRTLDDLLPQIQHKSEKAVLIHRPWDLLEYNRAAILEDFKALGKANDGQALAGAASVHMLAAENIHIAAGVKLYPGVVLDAQAGPIIIDAGAEIRANAVITGPTYVGQKVLIRTLAEIREDNSIGPGCRVGGEIIGTIFQGNGNKQHHGFLGQSPIGEWANLGAGTTTSNLKNTYGIIRMPLNGVEESTGRQFLGSVVGDHAKIGIGAYLSTGSLSGFASHVVVSRPPKFVPSFAWVTATGIERINFEKVEELAQTVMHRRGVEWTPADHDLFVRIASDSSLTEKYTWPAQR